MDKEEAGRKSPRGSRKRASQPEVALRSKSFLERVRDYTQTIDDLEEGVLLYPGVIAAWGEGKEIHFILDPALNSTRGPIQQLAATDAATNLIVAKLLKNGDSRERQLRRALFLGVRVAEQSENFSPSVKEYVELPLSRLLN